jgi:hypothetical protein
MAKNGGGLVVGNPKAVSLPNKKAKKVSAKKTKGKK